MDGVYEACEEATRFHDETYTVNHEDQMEGQSDLHKSCQAGRTPFYERPHEEKIPLDRTSFEDTNCPPSETGSLLAATRRTTTRGRSHLHYKDTIKINRKNMDIDTNSWKYLALQARCMEIHSKVVLEMKSVFVACDRQL